MSEAVAVSTDLLAAARAAPGFMPDDEGRALYEAARGVAVPGPFLEVGSWMGKSALYLAAAARETGRQVVTVDHHRGSEEHQPGWEYHDPSLVDPHVGLIDTLPRFRRTIADAGAEDVVVAVVTRAEVLAPLWSTPLALLFLDGSHTEESARRDQDAWVAKLAVGGTLAIHDVFPDPADGGQAPFGVYTRVLGLGRLRGAAGHRLAAPAPAAAMTDPLRRRAGRGAGPDRGADPRVRRGGGGVAVVQRRRRARPGGRDHRLRASAGGGPAGPGPAAAGRRRGGAGARASPAATGSARPAAARSRPNGWPPGPPPAPASTAPADAGAQAEPGRTSPHS